MRKISPVTHGLAEIGDKRRIAQVGEFRAVGIRLRNQFIRDVKLEVIAVRANYGFGESDGLVAARPVKRGLQHHFFGRIALGFVEAGGRFRFAKNIA